MERREDMSIINACYRFELKYAWLTPTFLLKPIFKVGNNIFFNELFETNDLVDRKRIGPIADIEGNYEAFPVEFTNKDGNKSMI